MQTYLDMLAYKRPDRSASERTFINRFLRPLGVREDAYGNLIKRIGTAPVLWSCHVDSVHRTSGKQRLKVDEHNQVTSLSGECLGADDASGIYILTEMIKAGREGLYVFHRGEESGCLGSSWIAANTPELLDGIQFAIAFDRQDFGDIITHQNGKRCASEAFAKQLASLIDPSYEPSSFGVYTDTAEYVDLVPECTNVSVGYRGQHRAAEVQCLDHLKALTAIMVELDTSSLVAHRDPKAVDPEDDWLTRFNTPPYEGRSFRYEPTETHEDYEPRRSHQSPYRRLLEAINDHPEVVASILEDYGIDADAILEMAFQGHGKVYAA